MTQKLELQKLFHRHLFVFLEEIVERERCEW